MNGNIAMDFPEQKLRFVGDYRLEYTMGRLRLKKTYKTFGFLVWFWIGLLALGFVVATVDWSSPEKIPSGALFALFISVLGGWVVPLYLFSSGAVFVFDADGFTCRGYVRFMNRSRFMRYPLETIAHFEFAQEQVAATHEGMILHNVLLISRKGTHPVLSCPSAFEAGCLADLLNVYLLSLKNRTWEPTSVIPG